MTSDTRLRQSLEQLDGQSYKAYKSLRGSYEFSDFSLTIDYVQGDPFAAPSRIRLQLPQSVAGFPSDWLSVPIRQTALADYLSRRAAQLARSIQQKRGSGKSGKILVPELSQAVLRRTVAWVDAAAVELRLAVGLPARGRRIAGYGAAALMCEDIPELVAGCLKYAALDAAALERQIAVVEDAAVLRSQLSDHNLIAFIADQAILPRRSGVDSRPLTAEVVPFRSSEALRVRLSAPHAGPVTGLGIPAGVTLIVGGGYHGKSTLLRAIEQGIYNAIPGDGREQVVTHPAAVKIRAEDGRSVAGVNISPFINHLPQDRSTADFSTPNASGSTSQAASIVEALEAGAQVLLIDEDTAATNFMIRDRKMQALIGKEKEPITPFIDKVRQLYDDHGISTILVMGGSGDYFDVADTVIAMDNYQPREVTAQAQAIAQSHQNIRQSEGGAQFGPISQRVILPQSIEQGNRPTKVKVRDTDNLALGYEAIDLRAVEQVIEPGQVRAIAQAMLYARQYYLDGRRSLAEVLDGVMADIERGSLDALSDRLGLDLVEFRRLELAAAFNRLRTLQAAPIDS